MTLVEVQVTSLFTLWVGTFISGILPIFCLRRKHSSAGGQRDGGGQGTNIVTSSLIYFGGGVLFSTALLHLLPEARESFIQKERVLSSIQNETAEFNLQEHSSDYDNHHNHGFALPEFTVLCGFFITYIIEVLLHKLLDRSNISTDTNNSHSTKFCSCSQRHIECSRTYKHTSPAKPATPFVKRKRSATWAGQLTSSNRVEDVPSETPPDLLQSSKTSQPYPNYGTVIEDPAPGRLIHVEGGITIATRAVAVPPKLPGIPEVESQTLKSPNTTTLSVASLLTIAALSFHSVFEGLAVGFQKSSTDTWTLLLAIVIHKFVIAFVIGVEAIVDGSKTSLIVGCAAVFASMSPIGIAIAMSLGTSIEQIPDIVIGVINCVATGTLLYVIFFEIWVRKAKEIPYKGMRFVAMTIGAVLTALLQYVTTLL